MISVVIPVYNVEKYLDKCLMSVCGQSYKDLQIILVNDGSTDNSLSICERFARSDSRIEVCSQENMGISSARNLGMKKAKGDYLTFVDADDHIDEDTYMKAMDRIGNCDALYFGYKEIYENSIKIIEPEKEGICSGFEALYQCFLPLGYYSSVCNKIFIRKLVEGLTFDNDIQVGEDELWLVRATKKIGRVFLLNDAMYNYVQRDDSAMHQQDKIDKKWLSALVSKNRILEELKDNERVFLTARAKLYNDLYYLYWLSYMSSDRKEMNKIREELDGYKRDFYDSDMYSIKRKIRYSLIKIMMYLHFPKETVFSMGNATSYKMRNGIRK